MNTNELLDDLIKFPLTFNGDYIFSGDLCAMMFCTTNKEKKKRIIEMINGDEIPGENHNGHSYSITDGYILEDNIPILLVRRSIIQDFLKEKNKTISFGQSIAMSDEFLYKIYKKLSSYRH